MLQSKIFFEFGFSDAIFHKFSLKCNILPDKFLPEYIFYCQKVGFLRHTAENSPMWSEDPRKPRIISRSDINTQDFLFHGNVFCEKIRWAPSEVAEVNGGRMVKERDFEAEKIQIIRKN